MARMRAIKPGFFNNEDLLDCAPLARILFAGLWCWGDREGRLEDRPKRFKMEILPGDNCDVDALLEELARAKMILRYEVAGERYIQVLKFKQHQRPHVKEAASTFPAPPKVGARPDPGNGEHAWDLGNGNGILDLGSGEGDGNSTREGAHETRHLHPDDDFVDDDELPPTGDFSETVESEGAAEAGADDFSAAPAAVVHANGWSFDVDAMAQLQEATADLALLPVELPMAISNRLKKRADLANEHNKTIAQRILLAWNTMSGSDVAAWSTTALAVGRRKKGDDRSGLVDFAAGIIAADLEVGADLVATERRRGIKVVGATPAAGPARADDATRANAEVAATKAQLADPERELRARMAIAVGAMKMHPAGSTQRAASAPIR